jgi:hypothetical protein
VSSASVDVRTSPALGAVDVVTSASGRSSTSGGQMTDRRYQLTGGGGWNDGSGHTVNLTGAAATENDYASVSGGVNGSYDFLDRTTTLLGGFTLTDNWISSILDPTLHHKMAAAGWSGGVARVLTPDDAIRLRYDGKFDDGYIASPYRNVRFGDWTTTTNAYGEVMFANTIGSTAGLPEHLPETRASNALTFEWVHSLGAGVGLHLGAREPRRMGNLERHNGASCSVTGSTHRPRPISSRASTRWRRRCTRTGARTRSSAGSSVISERSNFRECSPIPMALTTCECSCSCASMRFVTSYPGFLFLDSRTSVFLETGLTWER